MAKFKVVQGGLSKLGKNVGNAVKEVAESTKKTNPNKGGKAISKLAKQFDVEEKVVISAAKGMGYDSTKTLIRNGGEALDIDALRSSARRLQGIKNDGKAAAKKAVEEAQKNYGADAAQAKSILRHQKKTGNAIKYTNPDKPISQAVDARIQGNLANKSAEESAAVLSNPIKYGGEYAGKNGSTVVQKGGKMEELYKQNLRNGDSMDAAIKNAGSQYQTVDDKAFVEQLYSQKGYKDKNVKSEWAIAQENKTIAANDQTFIDELYAQKGYKDKNTQSVWAANQEKIRADEETLMKSIEGMKAREHKEAVNKKISENARANARKVEMQGPPEFHYESKDLITGSDQDIYMKKKTQSYINDNREDLLVNKNQDNPLYQKFADAGFVSANGEITTKNFNRGMAHFINEASGKDMGFMDKMDFYKVPQKAVAGASTFWLVNKLASSGGQQSNAQLYGQQAY